MSWHCWKVTGWKRSTESGTTSVYRTVFLFHGRPHMTLMPGQTVGFPTMSAVQCGMYMDSPRMPSYITAVQFLTRPFISYFNSYLQRSPFAFDWARRSSGLVGRKKSSSLRSGIFSFQALRNHGKKQTGAYKKWKYRFGKSRSCLIKIERLWFKRKK